MGTGIYGKSVWCENCIIRGSHKNVREIKYDSIIVRYSEIAIKSSGVRRNLIRLLSRQVKETIGKIDKECKVISVASRIIVKCNRPRECSNLIRYIPGISSVSPALSSKIDFEEIAKYIISILKALKPKTFAIRSQRVTKDLNFTSIEANTIIGEIIMKNVKNIKVNLEKPDVEVGVEFIKDRAYIFIDRLKGPGGLPIGSQGKVILVCTKKQSLLALWLILKRGCIPIIVCSEHHLVKEIMEFLRRVTPFLKVKVHILNWGEDFSESEKRILTLMYADVICGSESAEAIVVDDYFTTWRTENFLIDTFINKPIIRPLLYIDMFKSSFELDLGEIPLLSEMVLEETRYPSEDKILSLKTYLFNMLKGTMDENK